MQAIGLRRQLRMAAVDGQAVLGQVIGADAEEVHLACEYRCQQRCRGHFDHDADLQVAYFDLFAQTLHHVTRGTPFLHRTDHGEHDPQRATIGRGEQGAQLGFENLRALQAQANATHTEEGVFLGRHRPVWQGLVAADIQRTHHQRAPVQRIEHAPVLALLRGVIRRLGMLHEHQLGAQQAHRFRAQLHGVGGFTAGTDIGRHFHTHTVTGLRFAEALGMRLLAPLLRRLTFMQRLVALGRIRGDAQQAAVAIEQQRRALRQRQHAITGTDHGGNPQGASDDRAVRGGATASGEDAGHALTVEAGDVRRHHFGHHQNVGFVRLAGQLYATQMRQHTVADITQISRSLGQQWVMQRLLTLGRRLDLDLPGRLGARALGQAGVDVFTQRRIGEHGQVSTEDFPNARHAGAIDQALNLRSDSGQS